MQDVRVVRVLREQRDGVQVFDMYPPGRCGGSGAVGRVAKYVLRKAEEKWKVKGLGLPLGGKHDNEYVLRGMRWADNYWLFCDNKEIGMYGE